MPAAAAQQCLDENTVAELSEGLLSEARVSEIEAHVDACPDCRALLVSVSRSRPSQAPVSPAVGEVIAGKYRIDGLIGSGGMGVVMTAMHLLLNRRVAIKFMNVESLDSPEATLRFMREARASVQLRSDHAIRVMDLGTLLPGGTPYIVMEHLQGEDLGRRVARDGPLAVGVAASYLVQVCEAIAEAHRLGIVHRDIKPSNLFLTTDASGGASIKVLDFGLSKSVTAERDMSLTHTRAVMGSPFFMAPEQLLSARDVDARADLWALGATLYFLVTGRPPFAATTMPELSAAVLRDPPLALPPGVDPRLGEILSACLEKDPDRRMASAAQLAEALAPFAASAAPPAGAPRPSSRRSSAPPAVGGGARRTARRLALVFVPIFVAAAAFVLATSAHRANQGPTGLPVVVLMDTPVARGVYDADTVARGGTNADELNNRLRDLPVTLVKEALPSTWNREAHILGLRPDLIVIHRSALFHALNVEFGFTYPPWTDPKAEGPWRLLYRTADDKLIAFLGLVGTVHQHTRFLIYSRGTDLLWPDPAFRARWVTDAEQRFPVLRSRLTTMLIAGGLGSGTFRNPVVAGEMRKHVETILGLAKKSP